MRRSGAVALLVVGVIVAGCTSSDKTSSTGTLTGTFEAVGGPPPGMHQALSGRVSITEVSSEDESTAAGVTVEVGDDGLFTTELIPGRYALVGVSPAVGGVACTGGPVQVEASTTISVDVQCPLP